MTDKVELPKVECQYCGDEYAKRGIQAHEMSCDDRPSEEVDEEGSDTGEVDPGKGAVGRTPGDGEVLTCPNCGNHDDGTEPKIFDADGDAETLLIDEGPLGEEKREIIERNEYLCWDCFSCF